MNNVVLYSGGIDSFLVHHWLKKQNIDHKLLYFYLGGKYSINETSLFNTYEFKHTIGDIEISENLNMGDLERNDAFIPNRNLLAAIMAHSITNYDNIWIGGSLSDRVNDNNYEVFKSLSDLLSKMYEKKIVITSPFWNDHKPDLVKDFTNSNGWGQYSSNNEAAKALVHCTFSCYYPVQEANISRIVYNDNECEDYLSNQCMACPACFRKCMSLYAGGIFVAMKPEASNIVKHYYEEAKESLTKCDNVLMLSRMQWTVQYCNELYKHW